MKRILLLLSLTSISIAQNSTALFTLHSGQKLEGNIKEVKETYILLDNENAVLYKVLSSIELKNQEIANKIKHYIPDVRITKKSDLGLLLTFEEVKFDQVTEAVVDTRRVPFYTHPTNIGAGLFLNTNDKAFGFRLKAGYSTIIFKGLALGGYLTFNEWSPRGDTNSDMPQTSSSVATLIELIPILHILPAEFGYNTKMFLQLGAGYTISSSNSFVLTQNSETTSTRKSNLGGVSALVGIGSFDQIKYLGWISVSLNYHLGYVQSNFTNYVSFEFGIYL